MMENVFFQKRTMGIRLFIQEGKERGLILRSEDKKTNGYLVIL